MMKKITYLNRFIPYNWMYHKRRLAALERTKTYIKKDENSALKKKTPEGGILPQRKDFFTTYSI